ncbi:hypothetical protein Bpro_1108 [Polaromonas sp. JS666]|nr:hypothetical protein Bpro_1108 [Polaromonas sp. JS666]
MEYKPLPVVYRRLNSLLRMEAIFRLFLRPGMAAGLMLQRRESLVKSGFGKTDGALACFFADFLLSRPANPRWVKIPRIFQPPDAFSSWGCRPQIRSVDCGKIPIGCGQ